MSAAGVSGVLTPLPLAYACAREEYPMNHESSLGNATPARTRDDQHPPDQNARNTPDDLRRMLIESERDHACDPCEAGRLFDLLATDFDQARVEIVAMHRRRNRCRRCANFRRPGLSDGYCIARADLVLAYGRLHLLPADRGAWCAQFEFTEGEDR